MKSRELKADIHEIIRCIVCSSCPGCSPDHQERCEAMYKHEAEAIVKLLREKYNVIDTTQMPEKSSWKYRFTKWFCDNVNVCHGFKYDEYDALGNPVEKPENKIYNFFYKYWLWPFVQTDCICCNTVRGLIYGAVIGFILGKLL